MQACAAAKLLAGLKKLKCMSFDLLSALADSIQRSGGACCRRQPQLKNVAERLEADAICSKQFITTVNMLRFIARWPQQQRQI